MVEYLLSLKVDVDKQDKEGATPLHKSAYMGDNDVLKLLIEKGANVNSVVCAQSAADIRGRIDNDRSLVSGQ